VVDVKLDFANAAPLLPHTGKEKEDEAIIITIRLLKG
jgi:hypothetical protein